MKTIFRILTIMTLGLLVSGCTPEDKEYERYLQEKQLRDIEAKYLTRDEQSLPYAEKMRLIEARQRIIKVEQGMNSEKERVQNERNQAAAIGVVGAATVGALALNAMSR